MGYEGMKFRKTRGLTKIEIFGTKLISSKFVKSPLAPVPTHGYVAMDQQHLDTMVGVHEPHSWPGNSAGFKRPRKLS